MHYTVAPLSQHTGAEVCGIVMLQGDAPIC